MNIYVNNYYLDDEQNIAATSEEQNILLLAGAGSGKTLTIVGKIKYLIEEKNINPNEILCISFTNDAVNSLINKLSNYKIKVNTFHKLGISILTKNNYKYTICPNNYLEYVVHEFFYGIIFENKSFIKFILRYFNIFYLKDYSLKYRQFINDNYEKMMSFERLICRFIKLFKTNNKDIILFKKLVEKSFFNNKFFYLIVFNIYLIYENELKSCNMIDFDDMLIISTNIIKSGGYIDYYKYIIIDEYQDTSYIRYCLINSIIKRNNSKFMAVGDDFQSIYRFAGCDLNMFINFYKYYNNCKILKLENTYRNSQELIDVAGSFIMKNKLQINKNLRSNKSITRPIKICYDIDIIKLINFISGNIMILGRNNKDILQALNKTKNISVNANLKYYTVHSSKGLEEDNVIVLNMNDSILGFPNKIEDSKLLKPVLNNEYFLYEEERRLFYVALTRTKNYVYLMCNSKKESIFIKELIKNYKDKIEIINKKNRHSFNVD